MKLLIDTENKVIKIEENVNLGELIEKIKKLLPGEWKEYKLEANTQIVWANPIVIDRWPVYPYYPHWWDQPNYIGGSISMPDLAHTAGIADGQSITTDTVTIEPQNQYCIEC